MNAATTSDAPVPQSLPRALGAFSGTCIVIGGIVGVGIFFTPAKVAALAGSAQAAMLAWTIGGFIALCGGLTFAALGVRYPRAGGQYDVLRDAWGPLVGFLYVFCNATAIQAGAVAIIALICAENLPLMLFGQTCGFEATLVIAAGLIVGLTLANVVGVRWGSTVQNVTVVTKLAAIVGVIALALAVSGTAKATPVAAAASAPSAASGASLVMIAAAIVPVFFSYGGWQHGLWMAGEVRNPRRNLPIAIVGGVLLVIGVYVGVNWAYLHLLGYDGVVGSKTLAADAVGTVWPGAGRRLMAAAVCVSALGVLNAQLLSGPRLIYRLALDGRFFAVFSSVHQRFNTPWTAILLLGGMGLLLMLLAGKDGVDRLLTGVICIDSIFFVVTGAAALRLGRRPLPGVTTLDSRAASPASCASEAAPRYLGQPLAAVLFIIGETGVALGAFADPATRAASWIGLCWIAAAAAFYLLFRKRG